MTFWLCCFLLLLCSFFTDHQGYVDLYQRPGRRTTTFSWFLSGPDRESSVRVLPNDINISSVTITLKQIQHCCMYRCTVPKPTLATADKNSGGHLKFVNLCKFMFVCDWIGAMTIISPAIKDRNLIGITCFTLFG